MRGTAGKAGDDIDVQPLGGQNGGDGRQLFRRQAPREQCEDKPRRPCRATQASY